MYNDEHICKEVIVDEPEKKDTKNLKQIIVDWLWQPVARYDVLKLWLTLGHIGLTATLLIKSRKRK